MIYSMTGFASATRELATAALNVEIRSVNHRYLDLQFRLPEELRALETGLRDLATARLQRGKVECRIALNPLPNAAKSAELNNEALKQLRALCEKLRLAWPSVPGLSAADILRWPGMLSVQEVSVEALRADCYEALQAVLEDFTDSRAREGEKLKTILLERMASMEERIAVVTPRMPEILAAHKEKLSARLREAMAVADDERIRFSHQFRELHGRRLVENSDSIVADLSHDERERVTRNSGNTRGNRDNRKPRPICCWKRTGLCVGRRSSNVSTLGRSTPSL